MSKHTTSHHLEPTQDAGRELFSRGISGPVVMLNLLRFREVADYSAYPDMAPEQAISGEEAYRRYMRETLPYLEQSGGEVLFFGRGGTFFIGPVEERWDAVLLVKQASLQSFLAFASNPDYLPVLAHRVAALEDSRLLPLEQENA